MNAPADGDPWSPAWLAEAAAAHGVASPDPAEQPQPDVSDPELIKVKRRGQRLAERSTAATIHEMMQLPEVRAVVYRWLNACRAFAAHDFPHGVSIDPLQLARNAAHREMAQFILADLHRSAPRQYLLMLKEAQVSQ
ncbi:MAG: hypothetical protein ABSC06_25050 [Rhodopila sp.]|jgi:hypothetical protein